MSIRNLAHIWRSTAAAWQARSWLVVLLTFAVAAVPMIQLGTTVARLGVDVPLMDDWELAPVIAKAHTGELSFHDLFMQEEEARMIVPKLIFVASTWRGYWDVRDQMMLSVFVCVATAAGIYVLLRRSGLGLGISALCLWLSVLMISSPAQFELLLFASGFPSFLPVLFIVAALVIFETSLSVGAKFAVAIVLATMSSFTLAHGMLAWALTFPVYLLGHRIARWRWWAAGWVLAGSICFAAYLYGYRKPRHLPDFAPVIGAADYVQFMLAFFGGGFAYAVREHRLSLAIMVGAVTLTLFLAAAAYVAIYWRDRDLVRRTLPWFALGLYSIGSGLLATMGRIGFGIEYAISSRYVTFSLYLTVAAIALLPLIAGAVIARARAPVYPRIAFISAALLLLIVGLDLYAACFGRSMRILDSLWARNRLSDAAVLFSPAIDVSEIIKRINYPAPETASERAALLDRLGLRKRKLVSAEEAASLLTAAADRKTAGRVESIRPAEGDRLLATGWAALPAKGRAADAVVLSYETAGDPPVLFAMSQERVRRPDIRRVFRAPSQLWAGWTVSFPRDAVPAGASIKAWAVDARDRELYWLQQSTDEGHL